MTGKQTINKEDMIAHLGESFHTAFRKAVDSVEGVKIHRLIRDMDGKEWGAIMEFVYECINMFVNVEEQK